MKHKVSELEGALLDFAVARAEKLMTTWQDGESVIGRAVHTNDGIGMPLGVVGATGTQPAYSPSTLWEQGGPIIERQRIPVWPFDAEDASEGWAAAAQGSYMAGGTIDTQYDQRGQTPLIAAMRAYVASKFGEEVDLP